MPPAQSDGTGVGVGGADDFMLMEAEFVNQYRRVVDRVSERSDQQFAFSLLEARERRLLQRGIDGLPTFPPEAK